MTNPADCKYTKEHEWVRVEGKVATIGVTEFAQSELGEIVFVDLPEIGKSFTQGQTICVLESTKAASDVYAPISGTVKEINTALHDNPALINSEAFKGGWLCKLEGIVEAEAGNLMSADEYAQFLG